MANQAGGVSLSNNRLIYRVELKFLFAFKEFLVNDYAVDDIVKSISYNQRKDLTLPRILQELPGRVYNSWGLLDNTSFPPKIVPYDNEPQVILSDLIEASNNIVANVQSHVKWNEKTEDIYHGWHITSDPSVCGVDSQNIRNWLPRARDDADHWDSYGLDLVSPVLYSDKPEDRQDIFAILKTVKGDADDSHGAFITNQTGFHVHVQAPRKLEELQELAILCVVYEDQIAKLLPPCRRPGHRCSNYNTESNRLGLLFDDSYTDENKATYSDLFQDLPGTQSIAQIRAKVAAQTTKRKVVQLFNWPFKNTYQKYGNKNRQVNFTTTVPAVHFPQTVELRQARGSLDAEEIGHWIDFCIGLVRLSEFYVENPARFPASTWDNVNVFDLMNDMGLSNDAKGYWHAQVERWEEGVKGDEDDRTEIEPIPSVSDGNDNDGGGRLSGDDGGSGGHGKDKPSENGKKDDKLSEPQTLRPAFAPLPTGPFPQRGGFNGLPRSGPDLLSNTMRVATRRTFPRISAYNSPSQPGKRHIWGGGYDHTGPSVFRSLVQSPTTQPPAQSLDVSTFMLPVHPRGFSWPDIDRRILALTYSIFNDTAKAHDTRHHAKLVYNALLKGDTTCARLEWLKLELLLNENTQARRIDATIPPALIGTRDSTFYGRAVDVARMRNLIGVRGVTGIHAPYPEDLVNFAEVAMTRWQQGEFRIARLAYRESNRLMGEYHASKAPEQDKRPKSSVNKPKDQPRHPGAPLSVGSRPDPKTPDDMFFKNASANKNLAANKSPVRNQATTSQQQGQKRALENPDNAGASASKRPKLNETTPQLPKTSQTEVFRNPLTSATPGSIDISPTVVIDYDPPSIGIKRPRDEKDETELPMNLKKQKTEIEKEKEDQPVKVPSNGAQTDTFVALIIEYGNYVPGPISDAIMDILKNIHDELNGASINGAELKDMVASRIGIVVKEPNSQNIPDIGGAQVGERRVVGALNALSPDDTHFYTPGYWNVKGFNFAEWTTIPTARTYRMGTRTRNHICGFRALMLSMQAQYQGSRHLQPPPGMRLLDHLITIADQTFTRHNRERWEDELATVLNIWTSGEFVLATGLDDGTARRVGDQHRQQEKYGKNLYVHNINDNHWLGLKKQ